MNEKIEINGIAYVPESYATPGTGDGLRYAVVRSYAQGVMAGFVKSVEGQHVTLVKARQLWRWGSDFVLVEMANSGPSDKWENRYSEESVCEVDMLEACGVLYCTEEAMLAIRAVKAHKGD